MEVVDVALVLVLVWDVDVIEVVTVVAVVVVDDTVFVVVVAVFVVPVADVVLQSSSMLKCCQPAAVASTAISRSPELPSRHVCLAVLYENATHGASASHNA